jgi:hypothetical protein
MTRRVEELDFRHTIVVENGPPPWLGALVYTTTPLDPLSGINCFGRFDHPRGPVYIYVVSTASWPTDGHAAATGSLYRVPASAPARLPRRRASRIPRYSGPSEVMMTTDLAHALPRAMLGMDRE